MITSDSGFDMERAGYHRYGRFRSFRRVGRSVEKDGRVRYCCPLGFDGGGRGHDPRRPRGDRSSAGADEYDESPAVRSDGDYRFHRLRYVSSFSEAKAPLRVRVSSFRYAGACRVHGHGRHYGTGAEGRAVHVADLARAFDCGGGRRPSRPAGAADADGASRGRLCGGRHRRVVDCLHNCEISRRYADSVMARIFGGRVFAVPCPSVSLADLSSKTGQEKDNVMR